jgi:exopolyphosphatase
MESLRQLLARSRALVGVPATTSTTPLNICLGNVSVDMDSVVGSLTLAYYYSLRGGDFYVPAVNCKESFFPMKLDINMHLREHGLEPMIFMDTLGPLVSRIEKVALIDHNKLDKSQEE